MTAAATDWPALLDLHVRWVCGDDEDLEVNGDPSSTVGEEDEEGFDEFAGDQPEEAFSDDDGFDDAEGPDEEDADDDLDGDEDDG